MQVYNEYLNSSTTQEGEGDKAAKKEEQPEEKA